VAASPAEVITEVLAADPAGLERAVVLLRAGGTVALPTETVYGLAADAENPAAVQKIFTAKGRPQSQPLIVHVALTWAHEYASVWGRHHRALADAFWPGPLTMVVPRSDRALDAVTAGLASVGLRCPDHPVAAELLGRFGSGLAAPSANRYGHVSPTTVEHVLADLEGRIDAVIDGGACSVGLESTIVELGANGEIALLRRGAVTSAQIEAVTGVMVRDATAGPIRAPGMAMSHYAPQAPVEVLTAAQLSRRLDAPLAPTVLVIAPHRVDHPRSISLGADDDVFAAGLYEALRAGDDPEVTLVLVVPPPTGPLLPAIRDRLVRAAHPGRSERP
jgi:L-threonylcarbamoyladenylate synthase